MKKFVLLVLMILFSVSCFAETDGFMEEIIDVDFLQSGKQSSNKELYKTDEEQQNKTNEFSTFKKQNEKEIFELKQKIDNEEDGIVRLELENQIKAKKIELQAMQYCLDWANNVDELKIQDVLKETLKVKKETANLLDDFESILETKNDFMLDKFKKNIIEDQSYEQLEEAIIFENKNKVLVLMINTLKPFMQRLNKFQRDYFKSEGNNKVKISSLYKINSNYMGIKIIYISEQTVIYNLKYNISSFSKEEQDLIAKNPKHFTIVPVFSVTQNNNGTIAKMLTGFNVKNSNVEDEQIIKVSSNIKEFFEIERYKKMLKQYNE